MNFNSALNGVEGKILMFPNRIWVAKLKLDDRNKAERLSVLCKSVQAGDKGCTLTKRQQ